MLATKFSIQTWMKAQNERIVQFFISVFNSKRCLVVNTKTILEQKFRSDFPLIRQLLSQPTFEFLIFY